MAQVFPSGGTGGVNVPAGDLGGTNAAPTVVSTHLSSPLPVAQGGTGENNVFAAANNWTGQQTFVSPLVSPGNALIDTPPAGDAEIQNTGARTAISGPSGHGIGAGVDLWPDIATDPNSAVRFTLTANGIHAFTTNGGLEQNNFDDGTATHGSYTEGVADTGGVRTGRQAAPAAFPAITSGVAFQGETGRDIYVMIPISATVAGTVKLEVSKDNVAYRTVSGGVAIPAGVGDTLICLLMRSSTWARLTTVAGTITYGTATEI